MERGEGEEGREGGEGGEEGERLTWTREGGEEPVSTVIFVLLIFSFLRMNILIFILSKKRVMETGKNEGVAG